MMVVAKSNIINGWCSFYEKLTNSKVWDMQLYAFTKHIIMVSYDGHVIRWDLY